MKFETCWKMMKRWNQLVQLIFILVLTIIPFILGTSNGDSRHTWSIKIKIDNAEQTTKEYVDKLANHVANELRVFNKGQIGELKGFYLFESESNNHDHLVKLLKNHSHIEWHNEQVFLKRTKRSYSGNAASLVHFDDPLYNDQWHLSNPIGKDCNVTGVWAQNITGKGVVVAVVDDGVEWRHPDLRDNYCEEGSFNVFSNDNDPTPVLDDKEENKHGTRCAGEIAAVPNSVCGVGIAYGSKFSGIRVLGGSTTDSSEATAFNKHMDVNDVYSCSWGPEDDGKIVDGPHDLGGLALQHGVVAGRSGFGSIFVVASGNGGEAGDNCNFDGYASSIYTITIGAIDESGNKPSYAEECASMLACSVSSGGIYLRDIVTTDWSLPPANSHDQCTREHTGTSAATPLAAGMVALMLEVRPCLTWRDVQHIMVMTAVEVDHATAWTRNKAGFRHSNIHGFGLLDAWRLVNAAKVWQSVPWLTSYSPDTSCDKNHVISMDRHKPLVVHAEVSTEKCKNNMLSTLEYVVFTVTVTHHRRGNLKFIFLCPSGTRSDVPTRRLDESKDGLTDWSFSTVKCWGENPAGKYTLRVIDTTGKLPQGEILGVLKSWKLTLYGSSWTANEMKQRKTYIESVMNGSYLNSNFSLPCPLGTPLEFDVTTALSDRTIKLVTMISCFLLFWGVYYSIEMAFCNSEDKKKKETDNHDDQLEDEQIEMPQTGYDASSESTQLFPNSTFINANEDVAMLDMDENATINDISDKQVENEVGISNISDSGSFLSAELEVSSQSNNENNTIIDNLITNEEVT